MARTEGIQIPDGCSWTELLASRESEGGMAPRYSGEYRPTIQLAVDTPGSPHGYMKLTIADDAPSRLTPEGPWNYLLARGVVQAARGHTSGISGTSHATLQKLVAGGERWTEAAIPCRVTIRPWGGGDTVCHSAALAVAAFPISAAARAQVDMSSDADSIASGFRVWVDSVAVAAGFGSLHDGRLPPGVRREVRLYVGCCDTRRLVNHRLWGDSHVDQNASPTCRHDADAPCLRHRARSRRSPWQH